MAKHVYRVGVIADWVPMPGILPKQQEPEAVLVIDVDLSDRPVIVHDIWLGLYIMKALAKHNTDQWYVTDYTSFQIEKLKFTKPA